MKRGLHRLSARGVDSLKKVGVHSDGGGLYLRVQVSGSKSWLFVYQWDGKRREMGLGGLDSVTLARARDKAREARAMVANGEDPIALKKAARAIPTFGEMADDFIATQSRTTANDKSVARWKRALGDGEVSYATPIRGKRVDLVDTDDVLAILRPIWLDKAPTARMVRGYIERVLDAAKARRFRSGENPARFKGHLDSLLGGEAVSKRNVKHHAAMPYAEMPGFMAELRKRPATAAKALEFAILTGARTGEVLGATWGEIDLDTATWTVPAERMKAGQEHVVPLVSECIGLLRTLKQEGAKPEDVVFAKDQRSLSNMSMAMLMRRMGVGQFTVHGMRSAFRDFAGDCTDFPREIAEAALAHTLGAVEKAYRRGRALDKRRELMKAWARYLSGKSATVVKLRPGLTAAVGRVDMQKMNPPAKRRARAKAEANACQVSIFDE